MWFLGAVLGLIAGAMFDSLLAALLLGAAGAFVFHKLGNGGFARLLAEDRNPDEPSPNPDPALSALQRRLIALERRVMDLEQGTAGAAVAKADAQGATEADAEAAIRANAQPDAADGVASSMPPIVVRPAVATQPATALQPVRLSVDPAPAMAAATATSVPMPMPTVPRPPATPRPPPPPRPPALPLRDRLPAPLARLVFGGNMLVKLGVLILFLGLAFLLRYTAERVTVPIEWRYAGVALAGAALLALGWFLRTRRTGYALILQGAGIGVFYLTTLGAMKLHGLIEPAAGFGFLFAVAVLGAVLAVLQNAPALAIVAVLEGFAAPVLASSGSNLPVGLFTYLLVLDVGIFLIAWFKAWRLLNVIGLVGTFTLAARWAERYYTDAQYGTVQPFLLVFFVMFAVIGVLFARRTLFDAPTHDDRSLAARAIDTLRRVGRVDSTLVFGAPLAAFGLQYSLMRPWEFGAAFSALGFAAFYLGLGRFVFATQPRGLALLAEAYAIVGVIFATLAVPLGLEGQWTGATWAIEAAGMYWLGVRQARPYARAFAFALVVGAAVQLLRGITVSEAATGPLLHGSLVGPSIVAASVFAMWVQWRRAGLDRGNGREALAGVGLPWLGMAALVVLPWQLSTPIWAAAATALLALATFIVSSRLNLVPLRPVVLATQALALLAFIATLHRGAVGEGTGQAALGDGWQGMLAAATIASSVLATAAWSMRQAHRAALARGVQPEWPLAQVVAVVAGVGLLHLAMLFGVNLAQAALIWPATAAGVLWIALRIAHPPLAMLGAALHLAAALLFMHEWPTAPAEETAQAARAALPAFAHLGFWTPLALGLSALVAGDWLRGEARHAVAAGTHVGSRRWVNAWCERPAVLWWPVVWGLGWWLVAVLGESSRVLQANGLSAYQPAAMVGGVLASSVLASVVAARRDWRQLGQATAATLPGLAIAAGLGVVMALIDGSNIGVGGGVDYLPSSALGWVAWPLALAWHLRLLHAQQRWYPPATLAPAHVAGTWLFLLLAARECQAQLGRLGDASSNGASDWSLLGWVLVPALLLWALRSPASLRRWPLAGYRRAYLEWALAPVAVYLLGWCWVTNVLGPGNAAPLPFVPLLNPLELAHWLVLAALLLWCKALEGRTALPLTAPVVKGIASVTAWALLTGGVLRACHHFADVPWRADALYASWLTQAALSITWAVCGVGTMVLGHGWRSRTVWLGGAVLLGVVVTKLFFVELANQGGLFRIVSFIAVGALLLLVGYFAPVPPAKPALREASPA